MEGNNFSFQETNLSMTSSNFLLEFQLNISEIKKLDKMYFVHLFRDRIMFVSFIVLASLIAVDFLNINLDIDYFSWLMRSLLLIVFFVIFHSSLIDTVSVLVFQLRKKLLKFDRFQCQYKFTFTDTIISIQSPLGVLTHKWSKIEKVITTKNFIFIYIKERNGYIISIKKKEYDLKKIQKLITFLEQNVTHIISV